jgi:hypothetical protein
MWFRHQQQASRSGGSAFSSHLPPAGGPTGRTKVFDLDGKRLEFAEIAPGYRRIRRRIWSERGDLLGRIGESVGLDVGTPGRRAHLFFDGWVEVEETIWIARTPLPSVSEVMIAPKLRPMPAARSRLPGKAFRFADAAELYYASGTGALRTPGRSIALFADEDDSPATILGPGGAEGGRHGGAASAVGAVRGGGST